MESTSSQTPINSMRISNERLAQFTRIFEQKTGRKISESQALARAEMLLRTISILYHPINMKDYSSALAKKMFLKTKS